MGTVDCIVHPEPAVAPGPDLGDHLRLHLPELQPPVLEDQLEADCTSTSRTNGIGPVDVADEARRFFED